MYRLLSVSCLLAGVVFFVSNDTSSAEDPKLSVGAKTTIEKKLPVKISLDVKNVMIRNVIEEIDAAMAEAKGGKVRIKPKPGDGVTLTTRVTLSVKNAPLEEVLDLLVKNVDRGWGWYVHVGKPGEQDDGAIYITTNSKDRKYPNAGGGDKKDNPKKDDSKKDSKDK
jgi:hypothetical protein